MSSVSIKTVTLNRVRLYQQNIIDGECLKHIKTDARMQMLEHEDAVARRTILSMFGKTADYELQCPATWWQHLKMAVRERWPRLFRRLRVQMRIMRVETGAVMAGLPEPTASRYVIPFHSEPYAMTRMVGGLPQEDDE